MTESEGHDLYKTIRSAVEMFSLCPENTKQLVGELAWVDRKLADGMMQ